MNGEAKEHLSRGMVEGHVRRIHTIPVGDVHIHAAQAHCWCMPTEFHPGLFAHHAADVREAKERQTDEAVSEGWINIAEFVPA